MRTTSNSETTIADRSMGLGLRALNQLASSSLLDRVGVRKHLERLVFTASKNGFRTASAVGRTFKAAQGLGRPARQGMGKPRGLFDITPDEEQQMFCEAVRDFAGVKVRAAAPEADSECATPTELLAQASELGVNMLGVPEEHGGAMAEQAAVTAVLIGEALAHGDMGIAYAALAPGAVASAIGRWGTAAQQATYLPAFVGEDVPGGGAGDPRAKGPFDPLELSTVARRDGGDWIIDGPKSLVARPGECELFVVAAEADGHGPALFVLESGGDGLSVEPEPAMGLRPAAHRPADPRGRPSPGTAMIADGGARGLRGVRAARAARLVRAGAWAPRRPCSTT